MADEVEVFVLRAGARAKLLMGIGVLLAVSTAGVIAGWGVIAWIATVMCAVAFVGTLLDLCFPPRLEVDVAGFAIVRGGRRTEYRFAHCSAFKVVDQSLGRRRMSWVGFDYEGVTPRSSLQRANAVASGRNSLLKPAVFGLTGPELASILNRRRVG